MKNKIIINSLPQRCCVCRKLVESGGGLLEDAKLTTGRNDVYHLACAEEYYKRVMLKKKNKITK